MAAVVVGIDVSKDHLDVFIRPGGECFRVQRDGPGLDELLARLQLLAPSLVALEATGGLETIVAASLSMADLPVIIVKPAQVRHFAQSLGKRAKTDLFDAAVIAHFAEATNPDVPALPDKATRLLSALLTRRTQIIRMIVAERQRLRVMTAPRLKKSVERLLKALQKELEALDKDINDSVPSSPVWRAKEDLLRSVPGIGPTIARTLLAEMPELGTLDRREAASLAGLAPFTRQSGQWRGRSFIGGGRGNVRAMLYMGAMTAIRFNPALPAFYQRLLAPGKPSPVALVAVARRLLVILNAILRDQKPWSPA